MADAPTIDTEAASPELRGLAFGAVHNTLTDHRHQTPTEQTRAVLAALEQRGITLQWTAAVQRALDHERQP